MEQLAELIGAYAVAVLVCILALFLGTAILLWHWIERYGQTLWEWIGLLWRATLDLPPLIRLRRRFPRLWAFLGRRLSPEGYLGLHLTIGLALILAALFLFADLAEEIWSGDEIAFFDQALARALREHATPTALRVFSAITWLGNVSVLAALGIAVGLLLVVLRRKFLLAGWMTALMGGGLLNVALKALFRRARPVLPSPFVTESGWSFPSGHAMGALIAYGMLAYVLVILFNGRGRRWIVLTAALLVLLIGASRMYLGVHYFSDVIAGYVAGMAWLATCIAGAEIARRHRRGRSPTAT
ncbi:phosphatase PAP2 family protein [Candidatus Manganitrophus noduliformans]|uniref:phosphatase PAP2 family protein n=1 Tax=Candidatus Manganitrophus noduliformans TaxID=2606439 RepID=UPI00143C2678|nr:phosphatase PAP2 family protein [Candidatus Manganitrophus noduliformans]